MNLYTVLLIVLILALLGAFPTGGYGYGHYGYIAPGGLVLIVIILLLLR